MESSEPLSLWGQRRTGRIVLGKQLLWTDLLHMRREATAPTQQRPVEMKFSLRCVGGSLSHHNKSCADKLGNGHMFIALLYGAVTLDGQVDVIHFEAVWKLSISGLPCRQHAPPPRASLVSHPVFDFESYSSSASSEGWRSACPSRRSAIPSSGAPASSRKETFCPSRRWKKTTLGITPVKSSLGDLWSGGRLNWPWLVRLCLLWA